MEEKPDERVSTPRRKELRSLTHRKEKKRSERKRRRKFELEKFLIFASSAILLIVSIILYQLKYGSCEFWASYERNYNRIVYGDENYCQRGINTSLVLEKLSDQIVGQNESLELIRGSLNIANKDGYVQMILHGATGSGKTLSSEIVSDNFPNLRNKQKYIWNIHNTTILNEKAQSRLSKCGFNLIVLDDLESNKEALNFLKSFEENLRTEATKSHRIVLIAIFKDTLTEEVTEDLKNFVVIEFKPFTLESFISCIQLHERLFNIKLNPEDLEELKQINYESSGCKLISKKITTVK